MWSETYNVGTSTWSIAATGTDRFAIFSGASKSGTEALSVLASNKYVGIGTSNPGSRLEVVGDIISKEQSGRVVLVLQIMIHYLTSHMETECM